MAAGGQVARQLVGWMEKGTGGHVNVGMSDGRDPWTMDGWICEEWAKWRVINNC